MDTRFGGLDSEVVRHCGNPIEPHLSTFLPTFPLHLPPIMVEFFDPLLSLEEE